MSDKVTVPQIRAAKARGHKLSALTAYDATFARLFDEAGVDILLVGDSLGMVVQGRQNTLAVTVDDVIYHTRAVARATRRAHIVADMPFLSFQTAEDDAVRNAGRLLKEGNAEGVKLEGGVRCAGAVRRMVDAGIPVMGHVGLLPQSVHMMGGFRVQGRESETRRRILEDAGALAEAGVYSMVLEGIPSDLADEVTRTVSVPTIGIGAGSACDGQVLVSYDFLGLFDSFKPKFVKRYAQLAETVRDATRSYVSEVQAGAFPTAAHSFAAPADTGEATATTLPRVDRADGYGAATDDES